MGNNGSRIESLLRLTRDDSSALGDLLENYRPYLRLIARSKMGKRLSVRSDASDVVQKTFADVHQAFAGFRGSTEPEFSAFIKRIHYRNLADLVREHVGAEKKSLHREQSFESPDGTASFSWREPAADQTTPSQQLIRGEKALRLAALIESLPDMQAEAIRLRYMEGWPVEKIAQRLDRSLAATAGLLKRGLMELREKMTDKSWL